MWLMIKTELGFLEKIRANEPANIHALNYMRGSPHELSDFVPVFTSDANRAAHMSKRNLSEKLSVVIEFLRDAKKEVKIEVLEVI